MNHFANKVKNTFGQTHPIQSDKPSIICCSGGPDSVFLAHLMNELTNAEHHLIYFNHQLRPNEIAKEITIVEDLGKLLNYKVHIITLTCEEHNQNHYRFKRLAALATFAESYQIYDIYLGHHLNDHIETFVMQALKGATTELNGINAKTTIGNLTLYHPLLAITKDEIESWLNQESIKYSIDSSNLETDYTRNKLRPLISELFAIQNNRPDQIGTTIQYIQHLQKKASIGATIKSKIQPFHDQQLLLKEQLNAIPNAHYDLKQYIESNYSEYINKDRLRILETGLSNTNQTTIHLDNLTIDMDYKWIRFSTNKTTKFEVKTLQLNAITTTPFGNVCVTEFNTEMDSTNERLAIPKKAFKNLKIEQISTSEMTLTNQKKILRNQSISPIQQDNWPIISIDGIITWIPSAYHNNSKGNIVITFTSALNVNFEK